MRGFREVRETKEEEKKLALAIQMEQERLQREELGKTCKISYEEAKNFWENLWNQGDN